MTKATVKIPMTPPESRPAERPATKLPFMTSSLSTSSPLEPPDRRQGRRGAKPTLFGDQPIPAAILPFGRRRPLVKAVGGRHCPQMMDQRTSPKVGSRCSSSGLGLVDVIAPQLPFISRAPSDAGLALPAKSFMTVPPERLGPANASHEVTSGRRVLRANPWRLTPREKEVLAFLAAGKSNAQIAASLNISPSTVKSHVSSIYAKLDVSNRTQAGLVGLRIFAFSAALTG